MKKFFTLLILSLFFLCSCGGSTQWKPHSYKKTAKIVYKQVPADFIPRNLTVVSAGDSLTQGVGDSSNKGGYLPFLKKMLEKEKGIKEAEFYNFGVKGNRTTQLLKRLQSPEMKAAISKADLVILTIGGNDIVKVLRDNITDLQFSDFTRGKEEYIVHLTQIMETISEENPNAAIVLIGLYNPFSKWFANMEELDQIVKEWNHAGQSVMANYPNAYFVSIEDLFNKNSENLLYKDNFHPNDKGYNLIAQRLNQTLGERTLPDLEKNSYMVSKEEN
ncbi:SGNH/GDSL hydrolase family protein [Neobacillus niacini]|uniref:SGNH/GDSL hydrolase family protein n=1 Tax=Neobacillus niacini TaxID=86668 RepID=UPI00285B8E6A|nr:SGNH/GDSL hydrolase family protein [Neobacillus niacini]MDR6998185.1 lysophospholipase L1-like esterase [Neobacillus niacini]